MLIPALLCVATFLAALAGDYLETVYVQRVQERQEHTAAMASVWMYAVGFAGWAITIKISLYYCIPEVIGLYVGTRLAMRRRRVP